MKKVKKYSKTMILTILFSLLSTSVITAEDNNFDKSVFDGKRIAVCEGTIYVDTLTEIFKEPEPVYFDSVTNQMLSLRKGKTDCAIGDEPLLKYYASVAEDTNIRVERVDDAEDYLAAAANKTEEGLKYITQINEFLTKLKENGELERIQKKWFEGPDNQRVIDDYSDLPNINGELVAVFDDTCPPFSYVKNGTYVGYHIELVGLFAKEYGYHLNAQYCNFSGLITGLTTDKYDIAWTGISITPEREEIVYFSKPDCINYASVAFIDENIETTNTSFLDKIVKDFSNNFLKENRWLMFAQGAISTLKIAFFSILFGAIIGFVAHILTRSNQKVLAKISSFNRWLIKGVPEVVFLMILFYVIFGSSSISNIIVTIIAFSILFGCTVHETMISAESAIDKGQYLAATALGYSEKETFLKIIFPQILLFALPDSKSTITSHVKSTAIVGYISVVDITKVGDIVRGQTFSAFMPLILVSVVYFILCGLFRVIVNIISYYIEPKNRTKEDILKEFENDRD